MRAVENAYERLLWRYGLKERERELTLATQMANFCPLCERDMCITGVSPVGTMPVFLSKSALLRHAENDRRLQGPENLRYYAYRVSFAYGPIDLRDMGEKRTRVCDCAVLAIHLRFPGGAFTGYKQQWEEDE